MNQRTKDKDEIAKLLFEMAPEDPGFSEAELEILAGSKEETLKAMRKQHALLDTLDEEIEEQNLFLDSHWDDFDQLPNKEKIQLKTHQRAYLDILKEAEDSYFKIYEYCRKNLQRNGLNFEISVIDSLIQNQFNLQEERAFELTDTKREIDYLKEELMLSDKIRIALKKKSTDLTEYQNSFKEHGRSGGKKILFDEYYKIIESLVKDPKADLAKRGYIKKIVDGAERRVHEAYVTEGRTIPEPQVKQAYNIVKKITKLFLESKP